MWVSISLAFGVALLALVAAGYTKGWRWTGFAGHNDTDSAPKTLWDWLDLLIVPLVLALAVFALNDAQDRRDVRREAARARQQDRIAADTRREETLRDYLQRISSLVLDHGLGSNRSNPRAESLAQTLTMTVLPQLDGRRKGVVVQFLASADLIANSFTSRDGSAGPLVLDHADLRGLVLTHGDLTDTAIEGAYLQDADLRNVVADGASFFTSDLRGAQFDDASVDNTQFADADLRGADFSGVITTDEDQGGPLFTGSCLTGARFSDVILTRGSFGETQGHQVDFSGASFEAVRFENAQLAFVARRRPSFDSATRKTLPSGWGPRGVPMKASAQKLLCKDGIGPDG